MAAGSSIGALGDQPPGSPLSGAGVPGNDFRRSRAFSFLIAYVLDRLCRSMCHP
jgi:hypothetical protein